MLKNLVQLFTSRVLTGLGMRLSDEYDTDVNSNNEGKSQKQFAKADGCVGHTVRDLVNPHLLK